jgi:hypothetical protein
MPRRATKDPTEDIEAVLGRFQAWSEAKGGAREARPAKDGVREVSYEEALQASRSRWKGRDESIAAPTPASEEAGAPRRNTAAPLAAAPATPFVQPMPGKPGGTATAPSEAIERKTSLAVRGPAAPSGAALGGALGGAEAMPRIAVSRPAPAEALPHGEVRHTSLRQEFRTVLTQSVTTTAPRAALPKKKNEEPERQVSMSLRVAASEQAMIRRRAAEAGVSASAYLRQCALEVEILRAQVQGYMAAAAARNHIAEFEEAPRMALPAPQEGWFSRWQRKIWGPRTAQLSLKA